jgi:hypothetical protein
MRHEHEHRVRREPGHGHVAQSVTGFNGNALSREDDHCDWFGVDIET